MVGLYSRQESAQALAEKFAVSRPTLYAWKTQILGPEAPEPARVYRRVKQSKDGPYDEEEIHPRLSG